MATLKQKAFAAKVLENVRKGKNKPIEKIMKEVGYSKSVARCKQKKLLQSDGVQEILKKAGITHSRLSRKFSELLDAKKAVALYVEDEGSGEKTVRFDEDYRIQLDTAKFCAVMTKMSETDGEGNAGIPAVNIYLPAHEVAK